MRGLSCWAKPTTPDFHLFEMLDQHEMLVKEFKMPSLLFENQARKRLAHFYARFRTLPQLEEYFDSPAYRLPCNNKAGKLLTSGEINGEPYP